jgi:glutamate synthase domain-containing protein 3
MSFGALSLEAHEALAVAMNRIGGKSGTGEGGEQVERFGTERECSMKQVASGRFGVTANYLAHAKQIEIKMAQGSKPGEGGELPGGKVGEGIAEVRFTVPGVGLISPPPHHDIYSIEDLKQLIHDLKCANPDAEIHVKLVSKAGVGTIAAGVCKAHADAVLISGDSGGTGASVKTSIKFAGSPWELGLAETHQVLLANNLRSRIRVRADGGFKTGHDVVVAALLGAEEYGFGTAPLVTLGCIMLRKCHCNTCSVGIATQDPELRKRFTGDPEHVITYMRFVAEEVRELMASLGFRAMDEMIGRVDKLRQKDIKHRREIDVDLAPLLYQQSSEDDPRKTREQDHGLKNKLDNLLIERAQAAIDTREPVLIEAAITNRDRTAGTLLSATVTKRHGARALPPDTITVHLTGTAGQSFGAFIARGITLHLVGDANDYVGKGLSGSKISIRASHDAPFTAAENIIIGNVALYGATSGDAYFGGQAGERFAVRNSGAVAVVEGIGDHGCEYMTGGAIVILGPIGKNFGAGMSGGEAYVFDEGHDFASRLNQERVRAEQLDGERDRELVLRLLENHYAYTGSLKAGRILSNWEVHAPQFVKIIPDAYAEVVERHLAEGEDIRLLPPQRARAVNPKVCLST